MSSPASAMWFRLDAFGGSVYPILDAVSAASSPGDGTIAVTGVPAGTSIEAVRTLLYANGSLPINWQTSGDKFTVSYLALSRDNAVPIGSINFTANPVAASTITLNATVWTFVASGATGPQTNIGADLATTLASLVTNLNASVDAQVVKNTYATDGTKLFITNKTAGTTNNSYTLATNVVGASVSGATLTGGGRVSASSTFNTP